MRAGDRRYGRAVVDLARERGDVVIRASAAFLHAPAPAFAGIMKARGAVVGNAVPAEFIRWLGEAPEDEILQVTELLRDRGQEWRDGALAFANGPEMRDLWSLRDQAAQASDKAREDRSAGGVERKKKRAGKDEALKSEIMSKLNALRPKARSRRDAALRIETALIGGAFELGYYRIYEFSRTSKTRTRSKNFVRVLLSAARTLRLILCHHPRHTEALR
jgi:hypothetical protein